MTDISKHLRIIRERLERSKLQHVCYIGNAGSETDCPVCCGPALPEGYTNLTDIAKLLKCVERMEEAIIDADDFKNMRGTHLCVGWDCSNCAPITNPLYAALDDVRAILEEK